jgi:RNA polymerase sigma-70 factor, ECF subfamily
VLNSGGTGNSTQRKGSDDRPSACHNSVLLPGKPTPGASPGAIHLVSERELFEALYRRMAALAGRGAPDLDDLVQLAAEQVIKCRENFEGRSELSTWIYGVCYRVLLKQRRWYRRWSVRFRLEQEGDPMPSDDTMPSAMLERRERARRLQAALDRLSERHRTVVVLHDVEELTIAEIAGIVGSNELTVRSRLRDGRKRLRTLLSGDVERKPKVSPERAA